MRMIYIAHPFGGKQENVDKVQKIILSLLRKYPDYTFYSPLHATGFFYDEFKYLDGIEHCLEVLGRCDALWLCEGWRDSRGCNMEYGFARAKGIPVVQVLQDNGRRLFDIVPVEGDKHDD